MIKKYQCIKNKNVKTGSNYNRKGRSLFDFHYIKIYSPINTNAPDSRHPRIGYDFESKPSHFEEKLEGVSPFFHRRWMYFKGSEV